MHHLPRCAVSLFSIAALVIVCAGGVVAASANATPAAPEPSSGAANDTQHSNLSLAPGTAPIPVPERETHALLLIGLGLVGCIARRRGRGWRNQAVFDTQSVHQTPMHIPGRLMAGQKMG
jgi:hypothetical protein